MTKEITINGKAIVEAEGVHNRKCHKPVMCLETGEIFVSAKDTAKAKNVCTDMISRTCLGKVRSCKGQHFFYVSKATENLNLVATYIRRLVAENARLKVKAELYDAWQAELEAKRRAEEEEEQRRLFKQKMLEEMTAQVMEMETKIKALREELSA